MKPGRELDMLVAKKIFGCKVIRNELPEGLEQERGGALWAGIEHQLAECGCEPVPSGCWQGTWPHASNGLIPCLKEYSTDITTAWEVLTVLNKRMCWVNSMGQFLPYGAGAGNFKWGCSIAKPLDDREYSAEGETAAHAICMAALKAVGDEDETPDSAA